MISRRAGSSTIGPFLVEQRRAIEQVDGRRSAGEDFGNGSRLSRLLDGREGHGTGLGDLFAVEPDELAGERFDDQKYGGVHAPASNAEKRSEAECADDLALVAENAHHFGRRKRNGRDELEWHRRA